MTVDILSEIVYTDSSEKYAGKRLHAQSQRVFYCPIYEHLSTQSDGVEVQIKNGNPVGDAIVASRLPLHRPIAFFLLAVIAGIRTPGLTENY